MNKVYGEGFQFSGLLRLGWIGIAVGCGGIIDSANQFSCPFVHRATLHSYHSRAFQSPQSRWLEQGARVGAAVATRITGAPGRLHPSLCPPASCASPRLAR